MPNTNTLLNETTNTENTVLTTETPTQTEATTTEAKVVSINAQVNTATETKAAANPNAKTFKSFNLPEALQGALDKINFTNPTPIQVKAIPVALQGRDILGSAQTGTGKTAAFAIPAITKLINNPEATALILTPTRELATQVMATIRPLLNGSHGIKTALLIGGEFIGKQMTQLRNRPRLVIGTPGRVNDHLQRRSLDLSKTEVLILDETDRMLDLGFGIQIENIVRQIGNNPARPRQTLLFSATMPSNIMQLSKRYLTNPEVIAIEPEKVTTANVKQEFIKVGDADKQAALEDILSKTNGSVIVFVKTKMNTEKLAKKIASRYAVDVIHGDLRQSRRDSVIRKFRESQFQVLIATDVAARGLDIPHIETVVNYDLPQCPEDYVHRIGRTGRNGAKGEAFSFVSPADRRKMMDIEKMLNPGAKPQFEGRNERGSDRNSERNYDRKSRNGGARSGFGGGARRGDRSERPAGGRNDGPFGGFKSRDDNRGNDGRGNGDRFNENRGENRGRSESRGGFGGGFGGERRNDAPRNDFRGEGRSENRGFRNDTPRNNDGQNFRKPAPKNEFRSNEFSHNDSASHLQYSEDNFGNRIDDFADKTGQHHNSRPRTGAGFKGGFTGKPRTGGGYKGSRDGGQRNAFGTSRPRANGGDANRDGGARKPRNY
jgi:ATP-dependent RNA helicase DeaD